MVEQEQTSGEVTIRAVSRPGRFRFGRDGRGSTQLVLPERIAQGETGRVRASIGEADGAESNPVSSQPTGGRVGGVRVVGGKRATPPPASKLTGAVPVSSPKFKRVGGTKTIVVGIAACEISTDPRQVLLT